MSRMEPSAQTPEMHPTGSEADSTANLERNSGQSESSTPSTPPPTSHNNTISPTVDPLTASTNSTPASTDPTPLPAAEADLIEKAWVDKANQIIETQQDDPHQEEEQTENLSREYLKSRFGLNVDKS